jgi:hypothetical protein
MSEQRNDNNPVLEPQSQAEVEAEVNVEVGGAVNPSLVKKEQRAIDSKEDLLDSLTDWETKNQEREWREAGETHDLRKTYTTKLFFLTCLWLFAVLIFVAASAFRGILPTGLALPPIGWNMSPEECATCFARFYFSVTDKVLIAFITSTTASVIGIFVIVVKWLFTPPALTGAKVRAAVAARIAARDAQRTSEG